METGFVYQTAVQDFHFGPMELSVERFQSLDQTLDDYFAHYQKTGNESLFEALCPYFGVLWPSGGALASYCSKNFSLWGGWKALELGCGLAVPSLVLSKSGFLREVHATDFHPDVPGFLERNCKRNQVEVKNGALDWGTGNFQTTLVLGSDLVYDKSQPALLVGLLGRSIWQEAIFSDPGRPHWDALLDLCKKEGWKTEEFLWENNFFLRLRH